MKNLKPNCASLICTLALMQVFSYPAAEAQSDEEIKSWSEPAEPMKIVGPIHFVGTRGLGAYLITSAEGHILLFGGMPETAKLIEDSIRKLGFKPEDIKIMLTCHAHIDHVGTHEHFKKLSDARVAMMAEEVELLQSGGKTDFHYAKVPRFYFPKVTVDRVLRDGDRVTLGDVSLNARLTPGHTKGGTTWTTQVTEGGKAYLVVFPDGASVNPGYRLARHPSYPGIADDYRRSFQVHESLKPDIWLHSHTSFFGFESKRARAEKEGIQAWLDPDGYRQWVVSRRAIFDKAIEAEITGLDISGKPWHLISFTSSDGQIVTPESRTKYTVEFRDNGRANLRVDCNRGSGSWKLGGWNEIELGPLALTRAACPPDPLTDRFAKDWTALQRFEIKNNHLFLSLGTEGGTYEFASAE